MNIKNNFHQFLVDTLTCEVQQTWRRKKITFHFVDDRGLLVESGINKLCGDLTLEVGNAEFEMCGDQTILKVTDIYGKVFKFSAAPGELSWEIENE